jgi:hypothetical protein
MSNQITYIFGAGASAKVLPVDNALTEKLEDVLKKCKSHLETSTVKRYLNSLLLNHGWLLNEFEEEKSLDVIAKKYSNDETKLFNIKTLLWLYFSSKAGNHELDSRYINLLTRISGNGNIKSSIPSNVNFLSWNYDLQMEEAYSKLKEVIFNKTPEYLYALPGIKFLRNDFLVNRSYPESFQLIHLNGSAGYYYPIHEGDNYFWCNSNLETQEGIEKLAIFYAQQLITNRDIIAGIRDSLSFSWENTPLVYEIKINAIKQAEKITHLVIIGYSFPDLNKHFDYELFSAMKNLKHIFIQDLNNAEKTKNKLIERYEAFLDNVAIKIIEDCNQFHIPEFLR